MKNKNGLKKSQGKVSGILVSLVTFTFFDFVQISSQINNFVLGRVALNNILALDIGLLYIL